MENRRKSKEYKDLQEENIILREQSVLVKFFQFFKNQQLYF